MAAVDASRRYRIRLYLVLFACSAVLLASQCMATRYGSFDLDQDQSLIPLDEVHSGGPPKDGIPSIDRPVFVRVGERDEPDPDDRILGLVRQGEARAYPIDIMNYHEIVNDSFGREHVVVTYCPLCGSGLAFATMVGGRKLTFGVSGLLYNSDVLLYDRQTDSLWSQILKQGVTGEMKGRKLRMLPLTQTSWEAWKRQYPDTLVLTRDTGHSRNYDKGPYAGYEDSQGVWFPVAAKDARYHPKERVLGLEINGRFKGYPFVELERTDGGELVDSLGGTQFTVHYSGESRSAKVIDAQGNEIPSFVSFWFAWYAFHPDTEVYQAAR